jgi:hypothetical protein
MERFVLTMDAEDICLQDLPAEIVSSGGIRMG